MSMKRKETHNKEMNKNLDIKKNINLSIWISCDPKKVKVTLKNYLLLMKSHNWIFHDITQI